MESALRVEFYSHYLHVAESVESKTKVGLIRPYRKGENQEIDILESDVLPLNQALYFQYKSSMNEIVNVKGKTLRIAAFSKKRPRANLFSQWGT